MSSGIRCNMSREDGARILEEWDTDLTMEEEQRIETLFHPHLFYSSVTRSKKACFCESCRTSFDAEKKTEKQLWIKDHGDTVRCPKCGRTVEMICEGRIRTGKRLEESKCVMVIRADQDGALRMMAGVATRKYERQYYFDDWNNILHRELQPLMVFDVYRLYYLSPERRQCWKQGYWNYFGERGRYGGFEPKATIVPAFTPGFMGGWNCSVFDGMCNVIGAENISASYAKYSKAVDWIYGSDEPDDAKRVYGLEQFLAAYIEYPQLEFAVKMGEENAVRDLVLRGVKNHRIINWKAKDPAGFYRMDKHRFKEFKAAGGNTDDLVLAKELGISVEDVLAAKNAVGRGAVRELAGCAKKAGTTIKRAITYIGKKKGSRGGGIREWNDYLDMAHQLAYDLSMQEIAMPKNLLQAHDRAAELLKVETDRTIQKRYKQRRLPALRKKYEMSYAGMCIRVPNSAEEIVNEGKVLCHCVGGYAKRHLQGKTVILFLRRTGDSKKPLVTIEMMQDGKTIKQIHGWHNETVKVNGAYPPSPRETFAEFLNMWLDWLAAGSQRTSTGKPNIITKQEVKSA